MRGLVLIGTVVSACLGGLLVTHASQDVAPGDRQATEVVLGGSINAPETGAMPETATSAWPDTPNLDQPGLTETGMGAVRPAPRGTDTASAMTLLAGIAVMAYGLRKRRRR
jgi:hypothetical protein